MSIIKEPISLKADKELQEELREFSRATSEKRMKKLYAVANETAKMDPWINKPFYIVFVPTYSRENFDPDQPEPEDFIFVRHSCPTPGYNQNVFKYHPISQSLEFLWSIPRQALYWHIYRNKLKYIDDPKWKLRAAFICMMESGDLLNWVKKENGEKPDAVINITKKTEAEA